MSEQHGHGHSHGHGHGHGHGQGDGDRSVPRHGQAVPRHGEAPEEPVDFESFFDADAWDERFAGEQVWSGGPNDQLVAEASDLQAGTALDLGAGEGGDALWLARRGWAVTALDFSPVGLAAIAARAEAAGVGGAVTTEVGDVRSWTAQGRTWDLVTTHFLHLRDGGMARLLGELAAAVAPGGTLLVVGHDPSGMGHQEWEGFGAFWTAAELAAGMPSGFDVVAENRSREREFDGETQVIQDVVLVARRR